MPEHSNIPDSDLHEPKGVAGASVDTTYIADGSGSGTWKKVEADAVTITDTGAKFTATDAEAALAEIKDNEVGGWEYSKDDGTSTQTFTTTASKLTINGADSASEDSYLPLHIRGTDTLWDAAVDKITPIVEGDAYLCRLDVPVTAKTGSPSAVTLEVDLGTSSSPTTVIVTKTIPVTITPPFTFSVNITLFCGSTFITNGGQIFLKTDVGSITVDSPAIFINRISNGNN